MTEIAGIPYVEARFDKNGLLEHKPVLPAGVTDLFVVSHGWNNSASDARTLYRTLFENFVAVAQPGDLPGRRPAVLGVFWPSKQFDEQVVVSGVPPAAGGGVGLHAADAQSRQALEDKIDRMKQMFDEPAQQKTLDEAAALLPDLEDNGSARRAFIDKLRSLLDPTASGREDASDTFFKDDGNDVMKRLKVAAPDLDPRLAGHAGAVSLPLGVGTTAVAQGGAARFTDVLSGFAASAMNALNYTTYYVMKTRAGIVGQKGVAPLIDEIAPSVQRIHLIGHSFGGRVVAATAANSSTDRIRSLTLLQAAFSHNAFSETMKGFFRTVVDTQRVKGPILVTHTKNDTAVGIAYPLASRINGDTTAALGDENDKFGGLGRNGAQKMKDGETVGGKLLGESSSYAFRPHTFFNLEASDFVKEHGDVTGKQIAHALRCAIAD